MTATPVPVLPRPSSTRSSVPAVSSAPSSSAATLPTSSSTPTPPTLSPGQSYPLGAIVGGAVGSGAAALAILTLLLFCILRSSNVAPALASAVYSDKPGNLFHEVGGRALPGRAEVSEAGQRLACASRAQCHEVLTR